MTRSGEAPRSRPGGRSARIGAAVRAATLDVLAEDGFAGLSIDAVSERSGAHPTTIYRRWGSREGLIGDALTSLSDAEIPVPDTGSLRGDLEQVARHVATNLASPLGRAVAQAMVGHGDDPAIGRLSEEFWTSRFARTSIVVDRAVARGEVPATTDPRFVVEAVTSTIWFRSIVTRAPVDQQVIDDAVGLVLRGIDQVA